MYSHLPNAWERSQFVLGPPIYCEQPGLRPAKHKSVVALSATSKSPLDIYCHFSETFPQELLRSIRSVFTASAWPEQVLFWSADYPREAADSLVRRLPFGELRALAARRLGPSIAIWWVR